MQDQAVEKIEPHHVAGRFPAREARDVKQPEGVAGELDGLDRAEDRLAVQMVRSTQDPKTYQECRDGEYGD